MKFVIMAGGGGTRLWPVSRKNVPKQILPFLGEQTLLQATFERLAAAFDTKDIYISTNIKQKENVLSQLPQIDESNLILEPCKKDTAPAIGFAAVKLMTDDENANFITINSDAYIKNEAEYIRILKLVDQVIEKYQDKTVLVGIKPLYAETGYGYIKMASQFDKFADEKDGFDEVFGVECFVEKPDEKTAQKYVEQWEYLWNPALFCWNAKNLLQLFEKYLPNHYDLLMKIKDNIDNEEKVAQEFEKFEPISIDYGIMEKLDNMIVIPADFGWADVGNWRTIKDILSPEEENLIKGEVEVEDASGNLIYNYSDELVAAIGVKDLVIVKTDGITLICDKNKAQEVKKIVTKLKEQKRDRFL